jgi:hypothetical protein
VTEHPMTADEARDLTVARQMRAEWEALMQATANRACRRLGMEKSRVDYDLDACVWKLEPIEAPKVEPCALPPS